MSEPMMPRSAEGGAKEKLEKCKTSIIDGEFDLYYGGKEEGSFKPTDPQFADRIEKVREDLGLKYIFAPSLNFTRRTASVTEPTEQLYVVGPTNEKLEYAESGIVRTEAKADGGIVFFDELEAVGIKPEEIALAGFNADCPFIIGYEEEKRAFFMLHAGLACLHKTGEKGRQTIMSELIKEHGLDPKKKLEFKSPLVFKSVVMDEMMELFLMMF